MQLALTQGLARALDLVWVVPDADLNWRWAFILIFIVIVIIAICLTALDLKNELIISKK
ncbi:MAG: hypothetical protein ACLT8V_00195 [Streptococcus salivarius]